MRGPTRRRKEAALARQRRWHARGAKPGGPSETPRHEPHEVRQPRRPAEERAAPSGRGPAEGRNRRADPQQSLWLYGRHVAATVLANPVRRVRRVLALADAAEWLGGKRTEGGARAPEVEVVDRAALEALLPEGAVHQGVALLPEPLEELDVDDVVARAGESALVVLLDRVTDPHNVGAVLRSAAVFGAIGIVVPDYGAPDITGALAKSASGAVEQVPIVRVVNLARAMDALKEAGFSCVGLDETAERTLAEVAPKGRVAIAIGAEGAGLRRLTRERCDVLARLPASGAFASLNVSNAAAVALYELVRDGG